LAKKERLCPLCQKPLGKGETTCKECESKILQEATETLKEVMEPDEVPEEAEETDDLGIDLDELERTLSGIAESEEEPSLYLCPVCGVLLADGATACPRCGAEFLEDEREDEDEEDEQPKGHLCMECGGFIEEGASKCPHCGVEIVIEAKDKQVVKAKPASDALYLCPRCGAFLKADVESCDICGARMEEKMRIGVGDIDKIAPEIPEADIGMCPTCGAFLDPQTERCEICDAEVKVKVEKDAEEMLDELAPDEEVKEEYEPVEEEPEVPVEEEPEVPVEEEPETEDEDAILKELMEDVSLELDEDVSGEDALGLEEEIAAEKELEEVKEELEIGEVSEPEEEPETEEEPVPVEEPIPVEEPALADEPELVEEEAEIEPGEIDGEIDDFFEKLESIEIEKTMEEARLAPEPELVAEVDLGGDEEVPGELPIVQARVRSDELIQKGKAKERARRVSWSARAKGLPRWREYTAFAAVISCGIEYIMLQFRLPYFEWLVIFLFAGLFAVGMSFLGLSFDDIPRRLLRNSLLLWLGAIMIIAVPLHHFFNAAPTLQSLDYGLLVGGLALTILGVYLMGRGVQTHMMWTSGSLMILLAAFPLAIPLGSWPPSPGVEVGVFAIGSGLVIASFAFIIYEKWLKVLLDTQILYGDESMKRRRPTESIRSYDAAIKTSTSLSSVADVPSNSDLPWYSKGAALTILGRYDEALECIDAALKINPENEVAWVNRGTALSRLGRHREALKSFNEAIKKNPSYEVAWNNKGNTLARLKRYDEALKSYDMAIEIDEMYREAWVNKGYILAKMGRYEDAARCADFVASFSSL
jgi:tetratricopeptide (TPR) repeat protein/RNA polymerase subunit RPABC4/transcription elongation factor Spt4